MAVRHVKSLHGTRTIATGRFAKQVVVFINLDMLPFKTQLYAGLQFLSSLILDETEALACKQVGLGIRSTMKSHRMAAVVNLIGDARTGGMGDH